MLTGSSPKMTFLFFVDSEVFSFPFCIGEEELVGAFALELKVDGGACILLPMRTISSGWFGAGLSIFCDVVVVFFFFQTSSSRR